jgi:multiple sugar transport system permease protein
MNFSVHNHENPMKKQKNKLSHRLLAVLALLGLGAVAPAQTTKPQLGPTKVSVTRFYDPNTPQNPTTNRLLKLMREIPGLELEQWGGIQLPGGGSKASLMMAIAGKTAPDIGESWFHIIGSEIRNGFLYPLNEWIGDDTDGNGIIDDDETIWEPWKNVPPLWRKVAMHEGKVYGIPQATTYQMGVIFRTDLVRAAGLDPNSPPQTWDDLLHWCHKLTDPGKDVPGAKVARGQRGIALQPYGFTFLPWIQSAGGDPIVQYKTSPTSGEKYVFPPDATNFITDKGEDLNSVPSEWRADFTSAAAFAAGGLYHDLIWKPWLIHPETGAAIDLSPADIQAQTVEVDGTTISFDEKDIIKGVARAQGGQRGEGAFDYLATGEVAMLTWFVSDLNSIGQSTGINPDLLSWFPFPKGPFDNGRRVVQVQNHYAVMYEGVGRRPKAERDMIWKTLTAITDEEVRDNAVREKVLSGLARFANPKDLARLGYDEYLRDVPRAVQQNFADLEAGTISTQTEPFMGFWYTVDGALNNEVLSLIIAQTGEDFDYRAAMKEVDRKANSGMMFQMSSEDLDKYRPKARVVFAIIVALMAVLIVKIIRQHIRNKGGTLAGGRTGSRNVYNKWLAWAMVVPALGLIAMWSYYPLLRGMVMAFQDYKIAGNSPFVGLDNFILLAFDISFWKALGRTFYFVGLNMGLAFTAPILLAVLLTDVPRFKIFFRTLFFLPQMSSGLVIALLWKLMYEPTPQGFFNQIIALINKLPFVEIPAQQWLQDPALAMVCVVVPTVWASMGMASLIYLAALGSIPRDLYEAADVDGASIFSKFKNITLPSIYPLIIINFVGAFISTFQNMGNIFLMTFGGPGEATTVVGLKIWIEAYANLRFSMATSMAWILGSLLIGFTYFQIQFLGKIEYKRAK